MDITSKKHTHFTDEENQNLVFHLKILDLYTNQLNLDQWLSSEQLLKKPKLHISRSITEHYFYLWYFTMR